VRNRIRSARRQNARLRYLWRTGGFNKRTDFGGQHLDRVLRGAAAPATEAKAAEAEDGG